MKEFVIKSIKKQKDLGIASWISSIHHVIHSKVCLSLWFILPKGPVPHHSEGEVWLIRFGELRIIKFSSELRKVARFTRPSPRMQKHKTVAEKSLSNGAV